MNQAIYNHVKKQREKLTKKQHATYRELKNLWFDMEGRPANAKSTIFKLEELEHLDRSLNQQIKRLNKRLLKFELFNS